MTENAWAISKDYLISLQNYIFVRKLFHKLLFCIISIHGWSINVFSLLACDISSTYKYSSFKNVYIKTGISARLKKLNANSLHIAFIYCIWMKMNKCKRFSKDQHHSNIDSFGLYWYLLHAFVRYIFDNLKIFYIKYIE